QPAVFLVRLQVRTRGAVRTDDLQPPVGCRWLWRVATIGVHPVHARAAARVEFAAKLKSAAGLDLRKPDRHVFARLIIAGSKDVIDRDVIEAAVLTAQPNMRVRQFHPAL